MPTRRHLLGTTAALTSGAVLTAASPAAGTTDRGEPSDQDGRSEGTLALTHATLLGTDSVRGRRPTPDQTLLIRAGRIVAVGRSADIPVPPGAREVDLRGRYLMPGLVDAHTHNSGSREIVPPLYPLHGVTSAREMFGQRHHHRWRRQIERGRLLGPRWRIASPLIDGEPAIFTDDTDSSVIEVRDEAAARHTVRRLKHRTEADFLKVYSRLSRPAYFAIAEESRRQGIRYAGHCPDGVTVAEASDAGQQTVEHLHALLLATCSAERETEIRRRLAAVRLDPDEPSSLVRYRSWFDQIHPLEYEAVRAYDPARARALFDRLAANGTRVTPTLSIHHALERPDELPSDRPEWRYLPRWQVESWSESWSALTGGREPREAARIRAIYQHRLRLVAELHRAGVELLAGTDVGTGYLVPGHSLHGELELLDEAGVPTHRVLESATGAPARTLGLAPRADLLVLDANPLDDVAHTRRIHAVVVDGRYIDADERRRLLAEVEAAAEASEPPSAEAAAFGGASAASAPGGRCC